VATARVTATGAGSPRRVRDHPLVIFDLDGTLVDTATYAAEAVCRAVHEVSAATGEPLTAPGPAEVRAHFGMPAEHYYRGLFSPWSAEREALVHERAMAWQHRLLEDGTGRLFPRADELLGALTRSGREVAFFTHGSRAYLELLAKAFGLGAHGRHRVSSEGPPQRSKAELVAELLDRTALPSAVVVGDRLADLEAAHAHGLPAIGCLYGYGSPGELETAEHRVGALGELFAVLGVEEGAGVAA